MKLTIWSELARGGIADYAHDQATALAAGGVDVEMLCPPDYTIGREFSYAVKPVLRDLRPTGARPPRPLRAWRLANGILANARIVAEQIAERRPEAVLTHFGEYMSPLWAWRMRRLRRSGIGFHSVLHDPVRDYVVGPAWWHARSVREAFGFLDTVFVHQRDGVAVPPPAKVVWVPYGIHSYPAPARDARAVRAELGIPDGAAMLTSFGYIRDNKNLDLIIKAIAPLADVHLVIAGSEQAGGNRPVAAYRDLAQSLGCADRCHWITRFVSAEETADLMSASDLSLLVYSRSFMSSSAALGVTAHYRLPSLISSGSPTTEAMVRDYKLGIWVDPEDENSVRRAIAEWRANGLAPEWDRYTRDYSWARNAAIVTAAIQASAEPDHKVMGVSNHA